MKANVDDRASLERLYPREVFDREAGENAGAKATILRGLRLLSAVDADGNFEAARMARHVGERDPEGDTLFLAPFLAEAQAPLRQAETAYGGPQERGLPAAVPLERAEAYDAFIGRVIAAARSATFKPPIGRDEERLRGFHGG